MIRQLDVAIEKLLRTRVPGIAERKIQIAFDTPDADWNPEALTLNVFLWDVRRSPLEARSGRIRDVGEDGAVVRHRLAPPRIACRYLLTAWAKDPRDMHSILSSVLAVLLPIQRLPDDCMTGDLLASRPAPDLRTAYPNASDFVDFWSSLQGSVRPGIDLVATMSIDSAKPLEAGKPIGTARAVSAYSPVPGETGSLSELRACRVKDLAAVNAEVHAPSDATRVGADGTFWIAAEPGEEITVLSDPPKTATVPDDGKVIVLT